MTRYFFHTADGHCIEDESGVELPDIAAVKLTALRAVYEKSSTMPEFWSEGEIQILVQDDRGMTIMTLELVATCAPSMS